MAQRRVVPAALRDELTEYASLLRALRTNQTLDVTAYLTQPNDTSNEEPGASEQQAANLIPTSTTKHHSGRSASQQDLPPWKKRDQWTRWPLLAKDVPQPEWSLQDEVGIMVKDILALVSADSDSIIKCEEDADTDEDDDSEDEEIYMQDLAKLLTPVIENHLESLFALICAHTIARPDSMQNRIEPFDWRDLVNILGSPAALHLVDETMLQNLSTRMQTISDITPASASTLVPPPSPDSALDRHRLAKASRSRLNHALSRHTASLFEQTLPPPGYMYLTLNEIKQHKERRAKRKTKGRAAAKNKRSDHTEDSDPEEGQVEFPEEVEPLNSGDHEEDDDSEWNTGSGSGSDDER